MDNHCPFVIEKPEANPAIGLRQPSGIYTYKYKRRNHKTRHIIKS
jgi:hypothetical protein